MKYLVLNVRSWSVKDENTGVQRDGGTVTYIDLSSRPERGEKGQPVLQLTIDAEQVRDFTEAPGLYDMSFSQRRGARGKATIAFDRAVLAQPVSFSQPPQAVVTS